VTLRPSGFPLQSLPGIHGRQDRQRLTPRAARARQPERFCEGVGDARMPGGIGVKTIVAPEPGVGCDRVRGEIHQSSTGIGTHAAHSGVQRPDSWRDQPRNRQQRRQVGERERHDDSAARDARLVHVTHVSQHAGQIEPRTNDIIRPRKTRHEVGRQRQCGGELLLLDLARGQAPHAKVRVFEASVRGDLLREAP